MATNYKIIIFILLLITLIVYSCRWPNVNRNVLFQRSLPYAWKVVYVTEDNFPAGTTRYYEVFFDKEQLTIPKEIFGSIADISTFTGANAFDIHKENNNSVLLTIENITKRHNGSNSRQFISFFVDKVNIEGKKKTFWVYTLNREKIAEFEQ